MKKVLDKSIIQYLLRKGLEEEDFENYICDLELLFELDLTEDDFKVIHEYNRKWQIDRGYNVIDTNIIEVKGDIVKMNFNKNTGKYTIYINNDKYIVYRDLVDCLAGNSLEVNMPAALSVLYEAKELLGRFNNKKCTTSTFKRIKAIDSKIGELKYYILVTENKSNKVIVFENRETYLVNYNQFGYTLEEGKYNLIFKSGLILEYKELEDTMTILAGDFQRVDRLRMSPIEEYKKYEELDFEEFKHIFSLSQREEEILDKENDKENQDNYYMFNIIEVKSYINSLMKNKEYMDYKKLEFDFLKNKI